MRLTAALLAVAVFSLPAVAADYSLELRPENTKVQWALSDLIHTVNGTFQLKRGRIDFDPASGKASGQVVIDTTSGNSGNEARDRRMHGKVLESAKFPEAVFVPSQLEGTVAIPGNSRVRVRGSFTIHGATHEIAMDVDVVAAKDGIHAAMRFEVPYVAWGMMDPGNFLLKVSKTVQVSIEVSGRLERRPD